MLVKDVNAPHLMPLSHSRHLDVHFRLLRHDAVEKIRDINHKAAQEAFLESASNEAGNFIETKWNSLLVPGCQGRRCRTTRTIRSATLYELPLPTISGWSWNASFFTTGKRRDVWYFVPKHSYRRDVLSAMHYVVWNWHAVTIAVVSLEHASSTRSISPVRGDPITHLIAVINATQSAMLARTARHASRSVSHHANIRPRHESAMRITRHAWNW